jgi:RNA polymerase sigma factor (TIGR02999 family)
MEDDRADRILDHLQQVRGDDHPMDEVVTLVYDELRALAAYYLRGERPDHTLQPTALVHEVYLRLAERRDVDWNCRMHFIRIAARQIRRVLVDHARARGRIKRGGDMIRVTLTDDVAADTREVDLLALNQALERLDRNSSEDRTLVELKYFGGLNEQEIAEVLGVSERTVRRRWAFARAWLLRELAGEDGQTPDPS